MFFQPASFFFRRCGTYRRRNVRGFDPAQKDDARPSRFGPKKRRCPIVFFSVEMATVTGATTGATTVAAPARVTPLVVAAATLREIAFLSTTGSAVNNAKQLLALLTGKSIEAHFVFGDQQVDTTALFPFASLGFLLAQSPRWPCQC